MQPTATYQSTYHRMHQMLSKLVPDFELQEKAKLVVEINEWKRERNAIILGHNYMEPALYHTRLLILRVTR
jgi:quinolinate synthase